MRADGAPQVAVDTFAHYYDQLASGASGSIPESEIEPVEELQDAERLPEPGDDADALIDRAVVLRLNGGLGTRMGLTQAQSLVDAEGGASLLHVVARPIPAP